MSLVLRTPRLLLRPWRDEDVEAFAAMFDDPAVMEFLLPAQDRAAIDAIVGRVRAHFDRHGFGWWSAELQETQAFIGFIGLAHIPFEAHFTPAVEVGWRLAGAYWGQGYATEGARAALEAGFTQLHLEEIVSITVPANARSRRVMQRIGMTRDPADVSQWFASSAWLIFVAAEPRRKQAESAKMQGADAACARPSRSFARHG